MGERPKLSAAREFPRRSRRRKVPVVLGAAAAAIALISLAQFEPIGFWNWWTHRYSRIESSKVPIAHADLPTGVVEPEPIGTDSTISAVPLPLVLTGTRPGRNAYDGYALIGVSVRSPQTYRAGALLGNGARLKEIFSDYVVLERGGKTMRLYVTGHNVTGEQSAALASMASVGGDPAPLVTTPTSRDRLTDYIRASPEFDGNRFSGLVVYANRRSDAFYRLGLQDGDVIKAIDGTKLSDQGTALSALRQLSAGAAMMVTVKRGKTLQTLSLDGSRIL